MCIESMVMDNQKFVYKIAHQYKGMGVPFEDLVQEGNVGLINAAEKFDVNKGVKFITYAVHYIRMRMRNALNVNTITRRSYAYSSRLNSIKKTIRDFYIENDREPTTSEISSLSGISEKLITKCMRNNINGSFSLDQEIKDENGSQQMSDIFVSKHVDTLYEGSGCPTPDQNIVFSDDMDFIKNAINELPEKEQKIMKMRFYDQLKLETIAEEFGYTPAGIKLLIDRMCEKIRNKMLN